MRVLVLNRRHGTRRRTEDGAVAVIAALLIFIALILTALVVDLGMAWAAKRQLSVTADAAALAGATAVGEQLTRSYATDCTEAQLFAVNAQALARSTAEAVQQRNDPSGEAVIDDVTVGCTDRRQVLVTVQNSRTLRTFFTAAAGVEGAEELRPGQRATARYVRVRSAGNLRPWAVCDTTAEVARANPNGTYLIGINRDVMVTQDVLGCSGASNGPWGGADFDDSGPGADLAGWTERGYGQRVDFPDPALPAAVLDPATPDPGLAASLSTMVDQVVTLPVVTACTAPCTGADATFDAAGMVTVQICGFRYGIATDEGSCWDPALSSGVTADHIQFRWVPYTNASFDESGSDSVCGFGDDWCVGATQLYAP